MADAIQDVGDDEDADDPEHQRKVEEEDRYAHTYKDFEFEGNREDKDIDDIPEDIDGWHWALSDSDGEHDDEGADVVADGPGGGGAAAGGNPAKRVRVAEQRPEYIECQAAGLLMKPAGSTLGVHPDGCVWRGSYLNSKHYGRTWGTNRSPKRALLEVMRLVLEMHCNANPSDKMAKSQLQRVKRACIDA